MGQCCSLTNTKEQSQDSEIISKSTEGGKLTELPLLFNDKELLLLQDLTKQSEKDYSNKEDMYMNFFEQNQELLTKVLDQDHEETLQKIMSSNEEVTELINIAYKVQEKIDIIENQSQQKLNELQKVDLQIPDPLQNQLDIKQINANDLQISPAGSDGKSKQKNKKTDKKIGFALEDNKDETKISQITQDQDLNDDDKSNQKFIQTQKSILKKPKKDKKNGYQEKDQITNTPRKIKNKATVKFLIVNNDYE